MGLNWGSTSAFPESVGTWRGGQAALPALVSDFWPQQSRFILWEAPAGWLETSHISWVKCLGLKVNTVEPGLRTIALSWGRLLMSAWIWAMWLFNVALSFPLTSRKGSQGILGSNLCVLVCVSTGLHRYMYMCAFILKPNPTPNHSVFAKGEVPVRWSQCTARTGKLCPSICDNPHVVVPAYFLYKRKTI